MSMSMADLRHMPPISNSHHNGMTSGNGTTSLEPNEELEQVEDSVKAMQNIVAHLEEQFNRFQSVPKDERNRVQEMSRKRLLQCMLECRKRFDRCQERASEDLFS